MAIQHRLYGKFHIAFLAGIIIHGYLMQIYRGTYATVDIATSPIVRLILGLFDFNGGQRRYIKYTYAFLSFNDVV